ncbi:hypothetical protein DRP07_02240 [Archaeoglobales archaeon]|nr:MAG: hypothetical protein DRP07_02240 [Archaeoglobales archaeon]
MQYKIKHQNTWFWCDIEWLNPEYVIFRVKKENEPESNKKVYHVVNDVVYWEDEHYIKHKADDYTQKLYKKFKEFYAFIESIKDMRDLNGKTIVLRKKPVFFVKRVNSRAHKISVIPSKGVKIIPLPVMSGDLNASSPYFKIIFPGIGEYEIVEHYWNKDCYKVKVKIVVPKLRR